MLHIKRLYTFIYQTFIPVFAMTFGICLFIFIIQFLWQHIEKLVGKGLETTVILELFMYASLNLVPMVLPLSILLASLMTFGNMGERLELLAIKASGVSLLKIMRPMIILVAAISIGCFFFQNNAAPKFRVKLASLFLSIKEKSPELDIPEGSFYNELSGYSIYVKEKDLETHMLRGVIIYDSSSGGFKNMSVDVCDSAIMKFADSKDYLTITMFSGERFSNLKDEPGRKQSSRGSSSEFVPYMRENFTRKEVIIPFKNDLVRTDESRYDNTQISKDLSLLQLSIDSMNLKLDSLNRVDRNTILNQSFINYKKREPASIVAIADEDGENNKETVKAAVGILNIDSVYNSLSHSYKQDIMRSASTEARSVSGNHMMYFHIDTPKPMLQKNIRMHEIFWHRMFTLPFACLVFFFIGAPLGSIIRKGGLGIPAIISVILFIIYYILDNVGYKMARDAVWPVWQGIWLSTGILLPLGIFLTYKSISESALFNTEVYGKFLREKLKIKSDANWSQTREPKPEELLPLNRLVGVDLEQVTALRELDNNTLKDIVHNYLQYGYTPESRYVALALLKERDTYLFDVRIDNYDLTYSQKIISYFKENSMRFALPLYVLSVLIFLLGKIISGAGLLSWASTLSVVAYLAAYIKSVIYIGDFYKSVNKKRVIVGLIEAVLLLLFYPIQYFISIKKMNEAIEFTKKHLLY